MATDPGEARPTISTHVLDTERGVPAAGVRVALYRLDVAASPIRMTQALTDSRRTRPRPPRTTVDRRRLPHRIRCRPRGRVVLHEAQRGAADHRYRAQLPRAVAAGALFDDDLPRQLTRTRRGAARGAPAPLSGSADDDEPVDIDALRADDHELDGVRARRRPGPGEDRHPRLRGSTAAGRRSRPACHRRRPGTCRGSDPSARRSRWIAR